MEANDSSTEIAKLQQRSDTLLKVNALLNTCGSISVAIVIAYLIWMFLKKGSFKYMPIKLSLAIFGMLVINVFYGVISIMCDPAYGPNHCN